MSVPSSAIRIPDAAVREKYPAALGIVEDADGAVSAPANAPVRPAFVSPLGGAPAPAKRERSNLSAALRGPKDDAILPPARHGILFAMRRAVAVGLVVGEYVVEPLGYLDLGQRNQKGALGPAEKDRFQALVRAKAAISAYAAAAHMTQALGTKPSGTPADPGDVPASTNDALGWLVNAVALAVRGLPGDDDALSAAVAACAAAMDRAEADARRLSSALLPEYEKATYAIDEDGFRLHGFERPSASGARKTVELAVKRPDQVIGNHLAKAQAMRLARMLACHDFEKGLNPFVEVGGFVFTAIGDGQPGTGKTTLIQMVVGLLKGYCDTFGYGLTYENFGVDQISEYQGKSGQNCRGFVERVLDTRTIGFGTIDDIDQVAGRRGDKRSSAGQQEVTAVLMDAFAGASTIVRGNASFAMFSNYPENVDDALRQRAGVRWLVDGPQTREDYVDILALLLGKSEIPLGEHELYAAQAIKRMVDESYRNHGRPHEQGLLDVWDRFTRGSGAPTTLAGLGTYLHMIKEADPRFSGRAIKNVADAVKTRSMDIDLPDEWFASPEPFALRPFAEKVSMLQALRRPVTAEMVVQEINRYADSEFRYADKSDEAEIARLVRDHRVMEEARRRISTLEAPRG